MQIEVREYDMTLTPAPLTILDIGANIGAYALRCRELYPAAKITLF